MLERDIVSARVIPWRQPIANAGVLAEAAEDPSTSSAAVSADASSAVEATDTCSVIGRGPPKTRAASLVVNLFSHSLQCAIMSAKIKHGRLDFTHLDVDRLAAAGVPQPYPSATEYPCRLMHTIFAKQLKLLYRSART